MRTLRYILTRRPRSLADCLREALRRGGRAVVRLQREEEVTELRIRRQLLARWRIDLPAGAVAEGVECLGSVLLGDPPDLQRLSLHRANRRLACWRSTLRQGGLDAAGPEDRFDDSCLYPPP